MKEIKKFAKKYPCFTAFCIDLLVAVIGQTIGYYVASTVTGKFKRIKREGGEYKCQLQ